VLGLGTALLYPLTLSFAIGVAGRLGEVASARRRAGLRLACLFLLALPAVGALRFVAARALEFRRLPLREAERKRKRGSS
jgi:hypothetical protein